MNGIDADVSKREKSPIKSSTFSLFLKFALKQRTLLVLVILFIVVSIFIPSFFTVNNLLNVLRQVSITGIVAVGMTFVIITGGIDISVGSTVALGGIITGLLLKAGWGIAPSIILALFAGASVGLFNGVIIAYGKVIPFVSTLGAMYLIRGLTLIVARGQAIWGLPPTFVLIGTGYFLGIPIPVIITAIIYLFGHILLKYFAFGRYTFAIGGDEEAARLCGVAVKRVKMLNYAFCGLLSSTAGVILAGRLGSSQPSVGMGYELIAIAATVIGGTSLVGGRGTIIGTLLGALILGIVRNALNLLGISDFYQTVITGCIVIIAVLMDTLKKRD